MIAANHHLPDRSEKMTIKFATTIPSKIMATFGEYRLGQRIGLFHQRVIVECYANRLAECNCAACRL
jgi:hypothetical protein